MPSAKVLSQKQEAVKVIADKLQRATAGVFVDYKGINVEEDTKLRTELRNAGVDYTVVKNTLTRFAAKSVGLDGFDEILNGTTALAVSFDDQVAPAKILNSYAKKNEKFTIKAGFIDGAAISVEEVKALANIPAKEVLIAQLLYAINSPIQGLAVALDQIAKKDGEAVSEAAPEEAAAPEAAPVEAAPVEEAAPEAPEAAPEAPTEE